MLQLKKTNFFFLYSAFLILVLNLLILDKYFPLTEGWWETIGYLKNIGLEPYKDFNLNFPPVMPTIYSLLLKFTGNSFYYLRGIGVLIFLLVFYCLYKLLAIYFEDKNVAVFSSCAVLFLEIQNGTFIAKDYHTFVHLFEVLTLTFLLYYLKKKETSVRYYFLIAAIFFSTILFLTKQNVGLILVFSIIFIVILQNMKSLKKILLSLFLLISIYLIVLNLLLFLFNTDLYSIYQITFQNESKGSISHVILRFLSDPNNIHILKKTTLISVFLFGIFLNIKNFREVTNNLLQNKLFTYMCFFFIPLYLILFHHQNLIFSARILRELIIPIAFSTLFLSYILSSNFIREVKFKPEPSMIGKNSDVRFFFYPLFGLVYANSMTSGFNFSGLLLPLAFAISYILLNTTRNLVAKKGRLFIFMLALVQTSLFIYSLNSKKESAYSWWDYNVDSVLAKPGYKIHYPELNGFEVDSQTARLFSVINKEVTLFSRERNDVLFYPSIPIFYFLNKKIPPYKDVIYWFDVITNDQLETFLFDIKNKTPKLIVYLKPSKSTFDGHAVLKGMHMKQNDINDYFMSLIANGSYELIDMIDLENNKSTLKKEADNIKTHPTLYILKKIS